MVGALVGVIAALRTGEEQAHLGEDARQGILCAVLAAFGFGGFFVLLHEASTQDVLWAVAVQRATGFVVLAAAGAGAQAPAGDAPAGCADAGARGLAGSAGECAVRVRQHAGAREPVGGAGVVVPDGDGDPARVVLNERISRLQTSGVALALTGVALVAGR